MDQQQQAHMLPFPFPALGHIKPLLSLAELLCHAGLHVTFLNTDHNVRTIAASPTYNRFLYSLSHPPL
jgi:UDP:flavonoid glycosyltransferase YjiC (YdhE family)